MKGRVAAQRVLTTCRLTWDLHPREYQRELLVPDTIPVSTRSLSFHLVVDTVWLLSCRRLDWIMSIHTSRGHSHPADGQSVHAGFFTFIISHLVVAIFFSFWFQGVALVCSTTTTCALILAVELLRSCFVRHRAWNKQPTCWPSCCDMTKWLMNLLKINFFFVCVL